MQSKQWASGKAAKRCQQVGGSDPSLAILVPPPAAALKFCRPGFEPTPTNHDSDALPLDRWLLVAY